MVLLMRDHLFPLCSFAKPAMSISWNRRCEECVNGEKLIDKIEAQRQSARALVSLTRSEAKAKDLLHRSAQASIR